MHFQWLFLSALLIGLSFGVRPADAARAVSTERFTLPSQEEQNTDVVEPAIPNDALPTPGAPPLSEDETAVEDLVDRPPPPVSYDLDALPAEVRKKRDALLVAAKSGDIEKLRPLLEVGDQATSLSISGIDGDPIAFLKESSGDSEGHELMAILAEVLEAGYVRMDPDTEDETYIWPYFWAWPVNKLTPPQRVELFRILTAGDLEDSSEFGGYIFYRTGIRPDGSWAFFVAGD